MAGLLIPEELVDESIAGLNDRLFSIRNEVTSLRAVLEHTPGNLMTPTIRQILLTLFEAEEMLLHANEVQRRLANTLLYLRDPRQYILDKYVNR